MQAKYSAEILSSAEAPSVFHSLESLYQEAFPAAERIGMDVISADLRTTRRRMWVARHDCEIVAFAMCVDLGTGAWLLDYLATRPSLRNRGIGARLLRVVEDQALSDGLRCIYLEVEPGPADVLDDIRWRRLRWYMTQGAELITGAPNYKMMDQVSGGALAMSLLALPLATSGQPSGENLRRDLVAIFGRAYGLPDDAALVRENLADLC